MRVISCRLLTVIHKVINNRVIKEIKPKYFVNREFHVTGTRVMAQRSITSFFKVSPPKIDDLKDEKKEQKEEEAQSKINLEKSSDANGLEKKSFKRARLESSGSETEVIKSPKRTSEKIKKPKRQRIESSGSESELSTSGEHESPTLQQLTVNTEISESIENHEKLSEKEGESIKVEKSKKPKTYESPKSKKKQSKILSEANKAASPTKDSPERKSSSPKSNIKVKQELVSDRDVKSPEKNNFFFKVKQEVTDKKVKETVLESDYNPAKSKYHPIKDACWSAEQPVPYLALTRTLEIIEGTSARLKIIDILANYFRSVIALTPEDLLPSVYMCLNKLAPAYHSLELGIAETYLMKAVGACTGRSLAQVRAAALKAGELAAAAAAARSQQRTMFQAPPLTLRKVFQALKEIARMTGQASVNKKISKIQTLFVACRQSEAKFLIRSLEGKLRIGLAEQSVLQALAAAAAATPPNPAGVTALDASQGLSPEAFKSRVDEHALIIKTTYCECPNYDLVIPALLQHGVAALPRHCRLSVGIPLKPMLAHPTKGVHEVFNRFEGSEFTCEWKYDGERAQIHVPAAGGVGGGEGVTGGVTGSEGGGGGRADVSAAAIFSRNQEDNTSKYPDVLRRLPSLLKESVSSCILDCEAVAYDTVNKQILPFQVLSTRKRKAAVEADITVQVCVFVFDLLLLNGAPLVHQPLAERRRLLHQHFNTVQGEWEFARSLDCSSTEEVQQFLELAVGGSCEGLMVKTLRGDRAKYDIARRSHNWLKLKKDYLEGAGDTIDVVIIGAYVGRGRRAATYGGFLAAARDPASDSYQALCKLGTGFSDDDLAALSRDLNQHLIDAPRNYYSFDPSHAADAWFSAACVWEVRCADLSLSPAHRAGIGLVHPHRGISLRFPRFVRTRPDKTPEQATSSAQIAQMYLAQDQVKNQKNQTSAHNLDDFY